MDGMRQWLTRFVGLLVSTLLLLGVAATAAAAHGGESSSAEELVLTAIAILEVHPVPDAAVDDKILDAQEAKDPQKDMPFGILGSLAICTVLYVVVSAVLVGMVPYQELNNAAPTSYALEKVGAPYAIRLLVDVGAVMGLASVVLVMLLGQSRVFYSMSRDGLLGKWAGQVHPKVHTPYKSSIYTGIAVAIAAGALPLQLLGQLVNIGTLLAFALVCAGVWILRHKRPELERPFRTPWMPFVPIMGILTCVGLMLTLPADTWIRLFVWLVIGFVIYFTYGIRHSVLRRELPTPNKGS